MTGTIWRHDEVLALINLVREGKSAAQIAVTLTAQGNRDFTGDSIRKKLARMRLEGFDLPSLQGKAGRAPTSKKPKRVAPPASDRKPRKTSTIAGFQKLSMIALRANCTYEPAPVIAGFPTIQIRKDREGNPLAPVTLRRVDLSGARA